MYKPFLALLLLLDVSAFAQGSYTLVDREQVKKEATSKNYRKLIQRFEAFDSTLTPDDYRLIYYGAVFQKNFLRLLKKLLLMMILPAEDLSALKKEL